MKLSEIVKKVIEIVGIALAVEKENLTKVTQATVLKDLNSSIDALDFAKIFELISKEFGIREELQEDLTTVGDIVNFIIFAKIKDCLVDALGVDADEVTPEAIIIAKLGAESIDFLDIIFRLEKAFEIKLPREEFFPDLETLGYAHGDTIVVEKIEEIKAKFSFLNFKEWEKRPTVTSFGDLFTVQALVNFITIKLS